MICKKVNSANTPECLGRLKQLKKRLLQEKMEGSAEGRRNLRGTIRNCLTCGRAIYIFQSQDKNGRNKYCSNQCKFSKTVEQRFWGMVEKADPSQCWTWIGGTTRNGRPAFTDKKKVYVSARKAYELTFGNIPLGLLACHKCDNSQCVNPHHIFLGTQQDNMNDMKNKGRSLFGERGPMSKVRWIDVAKIRNMYVRRSKEFNQKRIGQMFGITQSAVSGIVLNKNWIQ